MLPLPPIQASRAGPVVDEMWREIRGLATPGPPALLLGAWPHCHPTQPLRKKKATSASSWAPPVAFLVRWRLILAPEWQAATVTLPNSTFPPHSVRNPCLTLPIRRSFASHFSPSLIRGCSKTTNMDGLIPLCMLHRSTTRPPLH